MDWADGKDWLERYAWFSLRLGTFKWIGPNADLVGEDGKLTALGRIYTYHTASKLRAAAAPDPAASYDELCGRCGAAMAAEAPSAADAVRSLAGRPPLSGAPLMYPIGELP